MNARSRVNFINSIVSGQKIPCKSCGTVNEEGSLFCMTCGKPLEKMETAEPVAEEPTPEEAPFEPFEPAAEEAVSEEAPFEPFEPATDEEVPEEAPFAPFAPIAEEAAPEEAVPEEAPFAPFAPLEPAAEETEPEESPFAPVTEDIHEETPKTNNIMEAFSPVIEEEEEISAFAEGLPDWDIVPPNVMVRRKRG